LSAGADIVMPMLNSVDGRRMRDMAPDERMEWHRRLVSQVDGPCLTTGVAEGSTLDDMWQAGYKVVVLPVLSFHAALDAIFGVLEDAFANGTGEEYFKKNPPKLRGWPLMNMLGIRKYQEIEDQFVPKEAASR
jgi:2-methylisocitrate lyase-like PEP mutase family enzyme